MSQLKTNSIANVAGTASTDVLNVINGSAKAWVNFNGTGTVAIRQSYNVSSITDNGTGDYTVNFTNAMPDANYGVNATTIPSSNGATVTFAGIATYNSSPAQTASAVRVGNYGSGGSSTTADTQQICVAVFR